MQTKLNVPTKLQSKLFPFVLQVGVPDEQIHLDLTEHQSSISTQDLTTELFSQLDPKLVKNLYQYYFYDFKMFNYKIQDVIKNWKS